MSFGHLIPKDRLFEPKQSNHPSEILPLYGSLRENSFSRLMPEEAARVLEFDADGHMAKSLYCNRMVDAMEELLKFTLLTRDRSDYLVGRYSERMESAEELSKRVNQK
jgi:hypothetical protein